MLRKQLSFKFKRIQLGNNVTLLRFFKCFQKSRKISKITQKHEFTRKIAVQKALQGILEGQNVGMAHGPDDLRIRQNIFQRRVRGPGTTDQVAEN